MRKTILLLFGILTAFAAICQTHTLSDGSKLVLTSDKDAVLIDASKPKEIIFAPGVNYKFILIEVPGNTSGKTIRISEVTTSPPLVLKQVIDNTAGVFKLPDGTIVNPITNVYSLTTWNSFSQLVSPNPGWCGIFDNSNCSFSYVVNSTVTYPFTGKRVEVWGEKTNNKGKIAFRIDNGTEKILDLYDPTTVNNKQVIFSAEVTQGTHTVTARITSEKNSASISTNLLIDNVKVYE